MGKICSRRSSDDAREAYQREAYRWSEKGTPMDTPGAKELLGMIARLEALAKERIALVEAGATVPVLDDGFAETLRWRKENGF